MGRKKATPPVETHAEPEIKNLIATDLANLSMLVEDIVRATHLIDVLPSDTLWTQDIDDVLLKVETKATLLARVAMLQRAGRPKRTTT